MKGVVVRADRAVTMVVLHLKDKMGGSSGFFRLINQHPAARDLFIKVYLSIAPLTRSLAILAKRRAFSSRYAWVHGASLLSLQQDCRAELGQLYLKQAYETAVGV